MTPEERRELLLSIEENRLQSDLFEHPGMKYFLGQLQKAHDASNTLNGIKTVEDLYFKKGELSILSWLLSWPEMVKQTLLANVEEAEAETLRSKQ